MAITFTKLTDAFAAAVHGVDIAAGVSDEDFAAIARLFNDYSVLVFHQQDITDEQQIAFSRRFGPWRALCDQCWGTEIALISTSSRRQRDHPPLTGV
jgi:alpha-ketoglutarate-dependent 2,4-dichlorophenoxyacetate dioxygenase